MGAIAAFKGAHIVENVRNVLGIELLCAAQGLDFIAEKPGKGVAAAQKFIREHIPTLTQDRVMSYDMEKMAELVFDETLVNAVETEIGPLL
jgi:histidine ammonia-lyase